MARNVAKSRSRRPTIGRPPEETGVNVETIPSDGRVGLVSPPPRSEGRQSGLTVRERLLVVFPFLRRKLNIAVLDDMFPQVLSAFRYEEFRSYLDQTVGLEIYSDGSAFSFVGESRSVSDVIESFLRLHPQNRGRVHPLSPTNFPIADAYYAIFLNNIYKYVNAIEQVDRPFAFTLYPGGGFALDEVQSDAKLKRVLGSRCFRYVIATQPVTRNYLLSRGLCRENQLRFIQGGVITRSAFEKPHRKLHFGINKNRLDICFVAARYTLRGEDKGYDLFVDAATRIIRAGLDAHFHVVGPWDETVLNLDDARWRFNFYGFQPTSFFRDFYRRMDLILSPNRPFKLGPGAFDGFPTGCCIEAALHEVVVACTDELNLNKQLEDGYDVIIIRPDADDIVEKLLPLLAQPDKFAKIGIRGRVGIARMFARQAQLPPRMNVLHEVAMKGLRDVKVPCR
jgi:glycosyltransferase involved in cell wall biosynthesis